jgi:hypothetical protein
MGKVFKSVIVFIVLFVVIPWIITWAVIYFAATPITNKFLNYYLNTEARVEKVETNIWLNSYLFKKLTILNPKGFGKGPLMETEDIYLTFLPKTFYTFKPYLDLKVRDLYFHYIRKSDNSTNIAVALGLPVIKGKVSPLDFEVKNTDIDVHVRTKKDIKFSAEGKFIGLGNNALFSLNGTADLSSSKKPLVTLNFVVNNWELKDIKVLKQLAIILNQPSLENLKLSRIVGSLRLEGDLITFGDVYLYTIDYLFAKVEKGSTYNRITKELHIKLDIFNPIKASILIEGTSENPKVKILKFDISSLKNLNVKSLINKPSQTLEKTIENPVNKIKQEIEKEKTLEPIKNILNQIKLP